MCFSLFCSPPLQINGQGLGQKVILYSSILNNGAIVTHDQYIRDKTNVHSLCFLFHVSHRLAKTIHPSRQKCIHIKKFLQNMQPGGCVHVEQDEVQTEAYSQSIIIKSQLLGRCGRLSVGELMPSRRYALRGCLQRSNSAGQRKNLLITNF